MVTDQIADLFTRIRNAQKAGHPAVMVPASRVKEGILQVLVQEGYVESFQRLEEAGNKSQLKVFLRYDRRGDPVIKELKRVSCPGRRVYVGKDKIPRFKGGLGMMLVSTPKGMMSDRQAKSEGIGGEIVGAIF